MWLLVKDTMIHETPSSPGIFLCMDGKKMVISFEECAKRFASAHPSSSGRCIGTRDVSQRTITLCSSPSVTIHFRGGLLAYFHSGKTAEKRFQQFQQMVIRLGYTTYDLS